MGKSRTFSMNMYQQTIYKLETGTGQCVCLG